MKKINKILSNLPINDIFKSLNIQDIPPISNGIDVKDVITYATAFSLASKGVSSLFHEFNSYQNNQIKREQIALQRMKQNEKTNANYQQRMFSNNLV